MNNRITEFQREYRFLSNFWPAKVHYLGKEYPSVENAYQAAKCDKPMDRLLFESCSAGAAKKLGRRASIRSDWEQVKEEVMLALLREKFSGPLGLQLVATGDAELIEGNWWGDTYWGVCNGVGKNRLGALLMQVRDEFVKKNQTT